MRDGVTSGVPMENDLLAALIGPLASPAHRWLDATAWPASLRDALASVVASVPLLLGAALVALVGTVRARRDARGVATACGAVAVVLAWWLVRHPSERFDELFRRGDHVVFAGLVGLASEAISADARKWMLAAIGAAVLLQYAGPAAVGVAVGATLAGLLVERAVRTAGRWTAFALHAVVVLGAYAVALRIRRADFMTGASVGGLLVFWLLRQVSLLVHVRRAGLPRLGDCAAYLAFYPGAMGLLGAPEVYDEFARRNLARRPAVDPPAAARRLAEGVALFVASRLIPVSVETIEHAASAPIAWGCAVLLFVRTALAITGIWRSVDATALFYGVRLRGNFAGLFTARNPSELWWAWRGTLTNWLVQHVYAPLGANRRHQLLNIAAAFAVSFVWHAAGVPFITAGFRPVQVAAVGIWAAVNAAAVIGHVAVSRSRLPAAATVLPAWLRVSLATLLTWALGSLTPILLSYQGDAVARLPDLLRALF